MRIKTAWCRKRIIKASAAHVYNVHQIQPSNKIQKQGQNIKIQHGFICFHFCQLNSPTQECSLSGSDLSQLRRWTYSSSQAVSGCTAASLFDFKGRGFLVREKPFIGKRRMTHSSFRFLLSRSLFFSMLIEQERHQC